MPLNEEEKALLERLRVAQGEQGDLAELQLPVNTNGCTETVLPYDYHGMARQHRFFDLLSGRPYRFRIKQVNRSPKKVLSDKSYIPSMSSYWATLKAVYSDPDYKTTAAYATMADEDKDLVDALYAAQTAQGDQSELQATYNRVKLSDETHIAGVTWADLRLSAMKADYMASAAYVSYSQLD